MKTLRNTTVALMLWACTTMLHAAAVLVPAGSGTINTAYASNPAADTLLLSGKYTLTANLDITRPLAILGSGSDTIVLQGGSLRPTGSDISVSFGGICFEGGGRAVYLANGSAAGITMQVDNCVFHGQTRAIYILNADAALSHLRITNSSFIDCGDADNRTVYCTNGAGALADVDILMDHCTFYNCKNTRMVYFPDLNGSVITNCVAMNDEENTAYKSFAIYGTNSALRNSISYMVEPYVRSSAASHNVSAQNPLFVDAAAGDFRYYANSPCIGAATDGSNLGDPRWGVSEEEADKSHFPLVLAKKPWSMSPTTSSVRILWETEDPDDSFGRVLYGTTGALGQEVVSDAGWSIPGEGYVHVVEITGLQPFTRYYFKVGDDTRVYDLLCSTKTAPLPGTAYRIFTLSDIHQNSCNNWQNMQSDICALNPDIAIFNGDFINEGDTRPWNSAFFAPGEPFLGQTPVMSSPGNHETGAPASYRWSTFYDYFSQFSHGDSEDPVKDPRGESYFTFPYGNAQVIIVNINGDASSPSFGPGSEEYQWLDRTLAASTSPWILIFGHVGIYTSGYHGQWSAEPKQWAPLLEQYAAQGKRIIYFCGDDHSFEHLYKDGVHYVRPGCGRNSNYAQQTALIDAQYSMFYRQISCYSTLDMEADASAIHLTARDSASNVFYRYTFRQTGDTVSPSLTFTAPDKQEEVVDSVLLQWFSFDPAKDASVSFYYTSQADYTQGELIASGISALPTATKRLWWNTRDVFPKGAYYVYATIASSAGTAKAVLPYPVVLQDDTIAPPAPSALTGDIRDGHYFLAWTNPTHLVHIDSLVQDFSASADGFTAGGEHGSASLSLSDGALRVDYTVTEAWGEGAANYACPEPADLSSTPVLSFRLKGDGSSRSLRLVVKNDFYGSEDWWFTEAFNLSSAEWKECAIDLRTLSAFDWHSNADVQNGLRGVVQICFIVPSSSPGSGTFFLDDIRLSGDVLPCADFASTTIVRRSDRFAESVTDGTKVYEGAQEYCTDTDADIRQVYYYSAFSADDRGNISAAATAAQWLSSDLNPDAAVNGLTVRKTPVKELRDGNLYIHTGSATYNVLGQKQ